MLARITAVKAVAFSDSADQLMVGAASFPLVVAAQVDGRHNGSHRLRPEPPPGPDGRRDCGSSEAEPVDRTSTKTLSIDGKCQS